MKKLAIGICIIAITAAFLPARHAKSLRTFSKAPGDNTLNGVDYDSAIGMIKNFENDSASDIGLKSACAWFNKAEIQKMQTVLTSQMNIVDGVRFYLGEVSKTGTKLQIEILL